MIKCFAPLIDNRCKILILGSMPGVKSLEEQQYYAHPRNYFWRILYTLFDEKYETDYKKRKAFILSHHIALWDVLKNCEREGSLDTAIREEEVNDFDFLFKTYPNIKFVFFNGSKGYETFRKKIGFKYDGITFEKLPSTSPAHAIKFESKLKSWRTIFHCSSMN
ncbi:DNA-deoxyinosine glycosylase [Cellulosilyticum sp. I15G10I2]|uniref:DNA-deoxyinosine glycosylase n=1 Tax=Cellulosilyticum sp. I15G10I2 TaxID=1892843 RepID=UPI00085CC79E|nr:DNA-deoxyinosine glycosylase [Cellulosilyticum sp. I15G10I2]